jgi:hypothetical protein
MMGAEYLLRGKRQGFDFAGLERVDMPPNTGGHCYTEFRRKDGSVQGVVLTSLLTPRDALATPEEEKK